MKLNQLIPGKTLFKIGNRWFVIRYFNEYEFRFEGGTWMPICVLNGVIKDALDYRRFPDSWFDVYIGQKVNLLG